MKNMTKIQREENIREVRKGDEDGRRRRETSKNRQEKREEIEKIYLFL